MVVIYGLVMFVPTGEVDGTAEKLTAIFVDGGSHVHAEHRPIARWAVGARELDDPWELPTDKDFLITIANGAAGGVDLGARPKFSQIASLFTHRDRASIEPGCLEPGGSCSKRGDDLTQGHATFTGEWGTWEATYCCGLPLPVTDHDEAMFDFRRSAGGNAHGDVGSAQLGTALAMMADVASLDEVTVIWDDEQQDLYRLDETACKAWFGETSGVEECAVLVMGNPPVAYHECKGNECRLDRHYSAFYRLAEDPPTRLNRWLPYVRANELCPVPDVDRQDDCLALFPAAQNPRSKPGKLNMPSVRCPPAFGEPPPEGLIEAE